MKIKAVSDGDCFARDGHLESLFSTRSFCAGGDGRGACRGDSGGGFFMEVEDAWVLKGIVSAGSLTGSGTCNALSLSIFTKVEDFKDWIFDIVEGNSTENAEMGMTTTEAAEEATTTTKEPCNSIPDKIYFPGEKFLKLCT